MADVKTYLTWALYGALLVCFLWLMFEFFMNNQWQLGALCIGCLLLCGSGFLMALIVGWQEAEKWNVKKLMRIYTVLFTLSFIVAANNMYREFMTPRAEAVDKTRTKQQLMKDQRSK